MFGFANRVLNWQAWVLILPTVYAIYRSYHLYLDRLENQSRRAEEERRHAEQVAELLTQTMAANEALLRANADLEQFAYAASHDLQEPLRMIANFSQLLQRRHRDDLGPDGKELLDTIIDGAHRINQLVADLLSYTRIENTETAKPASIDPAEVLREVQQALMDRITSVHAIVSWQDLAPVSIHRTHLIQLLQNLVSNSLKYHSPERKPSIHISSVPAAGGMVELKVEDNGIGIAPEYHERIFGVFKRLHASNVSGTGIGLAICKKIVQYYGGAIWVESHSDAGSTFHFTLPAGDLTDRNTGRVHSAESVSHLRESSARQPGRSAEPRADQRRRPATECGMAYQAAYSLPPVPQTGPAPGRTETYRNTAA
jgi:light-regulated signal transduction histidine kinase (bacteriophytochrome)